MRNISPYKKRKKTKKLQPYIVGSLMILLVFALALVLIVGSGNKLVKTSVSEQPSDISSVPPSSSVEEVPPPSDNTPSSSVQSLPPIIKKSDITGNAFTEEQTAQIDALIAKYEIINVPLSTISSKGTTSEGGSSNSSEFKDVSSKALEASDSVSSEIMVDIKSNVSIYYEDLASGDTFISNGDYKYFIASLVKAPYCMYLFDLAEQGKCDLNELLTIEYKDIKPGTGKINKMKKELFPLSLSVRELISHALRSSDNTAMETLRKKYSHVGYLEYTKSLELNYPNDVKNIVNGIANAKDCGIYIKAIYSYIETGKYGSELKEDMLNTTNPLIRSKYEIARKYGWAEASFHDMAIVYAPSPYLLVILSDKGMGYSSDYKFMAELSNLIGEFHKEKM